MRLLPDRRPGAGPPAYVGVGTQGADTQWWCGMLREHPAIDGPRAPRGSVSFFDQFCAREMTDADVAAYHAHFPQRPGVLSGEWTSRYIYDAWTPPLLRRAAPEARLLVLLVDPFERYVARLKRERARAESGEDQPFMSDAANRGRYGTQLRDLLAAFPRDQVLVLQNERCRLDPLGEYRRTLRFLGVDDGFVPRRLRRLARGKTGPTPALRAAHALGVPPGAKRQLRVWARRRFRDRLPKPQPVELWPDLEAALHDLLDPEMALLRELEPEIDLSLWPAFSSVRRPS